MVLQDDLIARCRNLPDGDLQCRIREAGRCGVGVLAGHTSNAEGIAAVGGHVDLCSRIIESQKLDGIGARLWVQAESSKNQDAVVIFADAEFAHRGDHSGRDMPVGLARSDAKVPGKYGTGQSDDDFVTDLEVVGTADNALHA